MYFPKITNLVYLINLNLVKGSALVHLKCYWSKMVSSKENVTPGSEKERAAKGGSFLAMLQPKAEALLVPS
jgi:hypothetical protein